MRLIRLLEHWGSRTISWLRRLRSLKRNCFKSELNWEDCAKFDEMLSLQKSASDWTGLGYGFSSSNIASTSTTLFSNNVEIENNNVKTDLVRQR